MAHVSVGAVSARVGTCSAFRAALRASAALAVAGGLSAGHAPEALAQLHWDGSGPAGDNIVQGGGGTWDDSGTNSWATDQTGGTNTIWTVNGAARFGAAAGGPPFGGTVEIDGQPSFSAMTFAADGYTLADGNITSGALQVGPGGATITVDTGTATISAPLTGSSDLVKQGSGTLSLSGANTYSGSTFVNAGTLSVSGGSALHDGSLVSLAGLSRLEVSGFGTENIGALQAASATTVDIATFNELRLTGTTNFNVEGALTGAGNLVVAGGRLNLSQASGNGFTGNIRLDTDGVSNPSGWLEAVTNNAVSDNATIIFGNAGTNEIRFLMANRTDTIGGLSGGGATDIVDLGATGALTVNQTVASTFSGRITGGGSFTKAGGGTMVLTGNNSYTGTTTVSGGTLRIVIGSLASTDIDITGGTLRVDAAGVLATGAVVDVTGSLLDVNANQTITTLNVSGTAGAVEVDIADGVTLTVTGTATVTSGDVDNTGSGTGTLNAGTFILNGANARVLDGIEVTSSNAFDLRQGTVDGVLAGSTGLDKSTAATVTLGGANTYTGATAINAGTLTAANASALGNDSAVTIASGATLNLTSGLAIGSLAGGGDVALGANTLTTGGDNSSTSFSGGISGTGGVTKTGTGTLSLTGANSYTGATAINAGTLTAANASALGNDSAVTIASGATLNLTSGLAIGSLAGGGGVTLGANTLTTGGDDSSTSFSGDISGTGGVTKTGTGTLSLTGTNSYSGVTTVSGGELAITGAGAIASSSQIIIQNGAELSLNETTDADVIGNAVNLFVNGTLDVDQAEAVGELTGLSIGAIEVAATLTIDQATNGSFAGNLSGVGNVVKRGAGTWTLSGNNAGYGGTVDVQAGDITIDGSAASVNIRASSTDITLTGGTNNAGMILINSNTTRLLSPGTATQSGVISQTGGGRPLTIAGGGTLTLAADNDYTGTTTIAGDTTVQFSGGAANIDSTTVTINSGTLIVDGTAQRLASAVTVNNADNFNVTGAETIGSLNNQAGGTTTVGAGQTLTIGGTGATALNQSGGTLSGGGTIDLTAADGGFTQSGAGTTTDGTLQINAASFAQSGGALIAAGTTVTSAGVQTLSGGTIEGALDGAGVVTVQTGTTSLTGTITNAASVGVASGTLSVTGTGSIDTSGDTIDINGGALTTDGGAIAANEAVSVRAAPGSALSTTGSETFASLDQAGGSVGAGLFNVTGLYSQSGGTTANGVDINAGTFTQTGGTIAAGTAVTSAGAQQLQGGAIAGRLDGAGAVTVSTGTTGLTGAIDGAASLTVTAGALNATGAGSIDTSGNAVAVNGGTLSTDGGALANDEAVTVGGGTLSTTGTEQVASIVLDGGTLGTGTFLAPVFGRTGGTLTATVTSDLRVDAIGGAIPTLGLGGVTATNGTAAGIEARLLNTGVMNVTGTTALDLDATGGGGPVTVTLDGQIIGTASTGVNARTSGTGSVQVDVNNNVTASGTGVSVTTVSGNATVTVDDTVSATGSGTAFAFGSTSGTATVTVGASGALSAPSGTAISATGGGTLNVANSGTLAGRLTGGAGASTVTNTGGWNVSGASDFGGTGDGDAVNNMAGGTLNFGAGASFTNLETFQNAGSVMAAGAVSLAGMSLFSNTGTFDADAGAATITGAGSSFRNTGFMSLGPGSVVSNFSGTTGGGNINADGATLNLGAGSRFTSFGPFTNAGVMNLAGDFTYQGTGFTNAATGRVDMINNAAQIFDVTGDLTGAAGSVIAMDINLGADKSNNDLVRVSGTVGGTTHFQLNDPVSADPVEPGTTTLLTAGTIASGASFSFGGLGDTGLYDFSVQQGVLGSVPSVYLLTQFDSAAASGLVSNFIAAQDAISTAFFKPSSGFVSSPLDPEPDQVGFAPWFRFNAGVANAKNGGLQQVRGSVLPPSAVRSEVNIDYVGYQFGFDGGLFNIGDTGANAHLGVIAGQIFGGADQTGFNSRTGVETTYVGGYAVYSNGPYFIDTQVRQEFTKYTLNVNEPGLTFSDTRVDSQRLSAGISAGFVHTLGEFAFVPVAGYTFARTQTDDVPITSANTGTGGPSGRIVFDDSPSHIGFAGLTIATNVLLNDEQLSLTPFVTLSAYNDFGAARQNQLQLGTLTSDITVERANLIGELSIGANFLTLAPEAFGENRVLTGNIRGDLQFGENILGGAVNMQMRLQF